jgi:hypothetical protein
MGWVFDVSVDRFWCSINSFLTLSTWDGLIGFGVQLIVLVIGIHLPFNAHFRSIVHEMGA